MAIATAVLQLEACSGGASNPRISGGSGGGASAGAGAGNGNRTGGSTGTTGGDGVPGTGGTAGATETSGGGATGVAGAANTGGTAGSEGTGGAVGSAGGAGTGGGSAPAPDASVDAGGARDAAPLTGIVKIMVTGSSNEIGTCWRALLWQELHANAITNFDFVGAVTTGMDCGVAGYDKDLQAENGIVITNLPASTYAGWFKAPFTPQIILMHFGGADILADMPVAGVMNAYALALAQARLANPKVILLIAQHTPEGKPAVVDLNAAIAAWAPQVSTPESPVIAVDLYTGILASDLRDGVHLNMVGSQKVADRFYAALLPFFKP
jgi:hypothetical protein